MTSIGMTAPAEHGVITALARIHVVRYLRHPLYILGVLLMTASLYMAYSRPDDAGYDWDGLGISTGMYLGILGVIVGYRLTVTEEKALTLLPSAPVDQRQRTLALLAACLVPAVTIALFMGLHAIVNQISPGTGAHEFSLRPGDGNIGWVDYIAHLTENVVAGFGAAALGVATARWLRFPGAGILAGVGLFMVEIAALGLGEGGVSAWDSWWAQGINNLMPWVYWGVAPDGVYDAMRPGSPTGHLIYAVALCGLAVAAAVLKGAGAETRATWMRRAWGLLGLAALGFLWANLG